MTNYKSYREVTMFLIIFLLFLILFFALKVKRPKKQKSKPSESDRLNLILQNVEAYDGSAKGQKRLEDVK